MGLHLFGDVTFQSTEVDRAPQSSAWPFCEQRHRGWWLHLTKTEGLLQRLWGIEDKQWSPLRRHSHSALTPWRWQGVATGQMAGDGYHSEGRNGFMSQENMTNMPDKNLPHDTLYSAPCCWHDMCGWKLLRVSPCRWHEKLPGWNVPKKENGWVKINITLDYNPADGKWS